MNSIHILGTITKEPELRYTQSGIAILSFSIAYNEKRKQQDGGYADISHFFDVTALGKKAETINSWFRKGSRILIQGSLDYQSWEKDGQKKSKVGIKLDDFDFIDKKDNQSNNGQANQAPNQGGYDGYGHQNQQSYQTNRPPVEYQNAQGQTYQPQPQKQMPSSMPDIDIDEDSIPFNGG